MHAEINANRPFGIEWELYVPVLTESTLSGVQQNLANILSSNGLSSIARSYSHERIPPNVTLVVESDSSITGDSIYKNVAFANLEVKTKIIGSINEYKEIAPKTLDILRFVNGKVNSSCGLHVHISVADLMRTQGYKFIRSLLNCVYKYENCIYSLVAPSRKTSHFCKPLPNYVSMWNKTGGRKYQSLIRSYFDRYYGLNLTHIYEPDPHLEVRIHHGSLDLDKLSQWLYLWLKLIEHCGARSCKAPKGKLPGTMKDLNNFFTTIGLKPNNKIYQSVSPELSECRKFWIKRFKHFSQPAVPADQLQEAI